MANVLFKRGDTATINGTAVTDGQLLYNTTTGQHYIDSDLTRKEVGKPVVNTTAEVSAITVDNISCGTKPVKELIESLSQTNYIFTKNSAYTLDFAINVSLKAGVLYTKVSGIVPAMPDWSEITVGSISGWYHGEILQLCIIHSAGSNSQSVMVNIKADGTVTIGTQTESVAAIIQQWFYGDSAILPPYSL